MNRLLETEPPQVLPLPDGCRNCGAPLTGAYCSSCGQKALEDAPTTWSLVRDWLDGVFSVDSRVARTALLLLTRPGLLAREHHEGRRAGYLRPVQLYSISSASFFALFLFTRPIDHEYYHLPPSDLSSYASSMARIVLLLIPIVALILKVIVRPRRLLAEHLVFALYTGAAGFAGVTLLLVCSSLWKWWWQSAAYSPIDVVRWIYAPGWLALLVYVLVSLKRAYGLHVWAALLDTIVLILLANGTFLALTLIAGRI